VIFDITQLFSHKNDSSTSACFLRFPLDLPLIHSNTPCTSIIIEVRTQSLVRANRAGAEHGKQVAHLTSWIIHPGLLRARAPPPPTPPRPPVLPRRFLLSSLKDFSKQVALAISEGRSLVEECELYESGVGYGGHRICDPRRWPPPPPLPPLSPAPAPAASASRCLFFSYGIERDTTFDEGMVALGCRGAAFDPTVQYKSTLLPGVLFFQVRLRNITLFSFLFLIRK
jgi:hypothetical protein